MFPFFFYGRVAAFAGVAFLRYVFVEKKYEEIVLEKARTSEQIAQAHTRGWWWVHRLQSSKKNRDGVVISTLGVDRGDKSFKRLSKKVLSGEEGESRLEKATQTESNENQLPRLHKRREQRLRRLESETLFTRRIN